MSQNLKPDIWDQYLVGVGTGDWTTWLSSGGYVTQVADVADQLGAVPMFTLYQMAANGDGNLTGLSNATFMTSYWANVKLMYQKIAEYSKPVLVHLEPDFWGYVQRQATGGDPTKMFAYVNSNADCSGLPNDATGVARCLLSMARQYAPKAYVGFSPSEWGGDSTASVVAFMNQLRAGEADFVIMQTLDRDAGCFEVTPHPAECTRDGTGWYWDETNVSTPNFAQHLAKANQFHTGINDLPLIWWQTPMGVPSSTPGGTPGHYRDNREHYFLTHPAELVAVGGVGVVFSGGASNQTSITTDGGQFQTLSTNYFNAPASLQ